MPDPRASAATPDPSTEAGRREMDRQAGLAQEVSDAAEAWLSGNVAVPSPAERADYRNGATVPRGHEWVEVSAFAGRFCSRCGVDEDDQDDVRWDSCQPEAAHAAD